MVQILDQYGNPIQREVLNEPQSALLSWVKAEFAEHPSRRLTPQRLHRILEDAERGNISAQHDLFVDMEEKDAHIFAELSKRRRAILTLDWSVEPPNNATAAEKKQAEQLQEQLRDIPDLDDVFFDCLDAIGHGFAALEIEWKRLGSDWLPRSLTHRPQRWFQTVPTDGNALRLRDGTTNGAEPWQFGWVIHRHRAKSGYVTRAGLHRVLAWPYLFKNYSVRDLAEFLEIYGLPLRLGKYPSGATNDEKATLLRAVAGIGHNAAGIIPEGMSIEFEDAAKGSHEPFQAMLDWCERSESKAILGGTLTSQADGKTSTNALGTIHNEVRHDLLVSDAVQLAGTLTRDLLYPMAVLNGGQVDPRRMPRIVFDTREPEDLALMAEALPPLVALGVQVPASWVHDKLAIPAPKNGEPVLVAPRPDMALPPELRPKPAQAALSYRHVALNDQGEVIYPDQAALDATSVPDALNAGLDALMAPAILAIRDGATPDDAIAALAAAYPDMDDTAISEILARAIFVADVWGRVNAQG